MSRIVLAALALACAISSAAFAAEVVAPVPVAPAVILPWGDWVVAFGQSHQRLRSRAQFAVGRFGG